MITKYRDRTDSDPKGILKSPGKIKQVDKILQTYLILKTIDQRLDSEKTKWLLSTFSDRRTMADNCKINIILF